MAEVSLDEIIGQHGVFIDGDWVESKDQDPNGGVRLIQLADIGDGYFINKSSRYLTIEKAQELNCTFLKQGDLLIARMPDPLGRACIFPGLDMHCVTVVDVCIVRPENNLVSIAWLKYLVNSHNFRSKINKFITGTTRQRISRGNLTKLKFELVPTVEQIRIATVLSKAETLIAQRKESIRLLDEFLKSKFLEMFGDKQNNNPKYSINDLKSGGNETFSNGPFGSDLLTTELVKEGIPVIYIRDIRNGVFKWKSNVFVTKEKADTLQNCHVKPGDVLIAKVGDPPGISAVYPEELGMAIITQDVIRIRLNTNLVLPKFFNFFINSNEGQQLIKKISIEGTRNRFPLGDFKKLKVSLPGIDEQRKFTSLVDKGNSIKTYYERSLSELKNLFNSLSQQAFKGELDLSQMRVVVPDYVTSQNNKTEQLLQKDPRNTKTVSNEAIETVAMQSVANKIIENFKGFHFSFEMLRSFIADEKINYDEYFSSEEMKKNPKLNVNPDNVEDLKNFVSSAIVNHVSDLQLPKNPWIKLNQLFYDASKTDLQLNLRLEDIEKTKTRSIEEQSGIYFEIIS